MTIIDRTKNLDETLGAGSQYSASRRSSRRPHNEENHPGDQGTINHPLDERPDPKLPINQARKNQPIDDGKRGDLGGGCQAEQDAAKQMTGMSKGNTPAKLAAKICFRLGAG